MIENREEYAIMYQVESQHWWYKSLHRKVLEQLKQFAIPKSASILDIGCGTGGMLEILKSNGFTDSKGFDYSVDAVEFSQKRGLNVHLDSILDLDKSYTLQSFDVVVCNDVLYQFSEDQIQSIFVSIQKLLKPQGLFISNNQAYAVFRGLHDIAVGAKKRFVPADFKRYIHTASELEIIHIHAWSLFLSPLIALVRTIQRIKLKMNCVDASRIKSDVEVTPKWQNNLFEELLKQEEVFFPRNLWGSSLFVVFQKK
ncbi:MAG: class I SAM-dependent methyltransferase [Leadbetterella sp.]